MAFTAPKWVFNMLNFIERATAYAQGKGYGSATIEQEIGFLQELLKVQPKIAVDIGGNVGDYTAKLRANNPHLEIHVFEPSAENLAKLSVRFEGDNLIKLVPAAISDRAGPAVLFSNEPGSGLGSLTKRRLDHFNIAFDASEAISAICFEDYWRDQLQSRQLDIVKIDIEGHEFAALRGFGRALDAVRILQFEFGGCNIDTRTYFQDFWYFFKEHKFDVYRITPLGLEQILLYVESDEVFSTTNYLAVNQRWIGATA